MTAGVTVPWADVQGNILRAYLFPRARFLFAEITERDAGRAWLRDVIHPVVQAPPPGHRQPPRRAVNVAFSHAGLAALGTTPRGLGALPTEFREGMWARAARLGDEDWERVWCNQPAGDPRDHERIAVGGSDRPPATHVLVAVHAEEPADLDEVSAAVGPAPGTAGVRPVGRIDLAVLEADGSHRPRREHFGFADGLSQPRITGVDRAADTGPEAWWRRLPWWSTWLGRPPVEPNPLIRLGEFILGHPDEDDPTPVLPEPADLFRNGSYLVVRKLAQDVPAFRSFMAGAAERARAAGHAGVDDLDIAAGVMGRRLDGEPLVGAPAHGDRDRDFSYRGDPDGTLCPLGAHIRRSNPRDGHVLGAAAVNRHRLLRRGLPYGPRDDTAPDDAERGIVFVSYGASISRQFEFVQRSWLNDGDAVGIGHTADVIAGAPGVTATVPLPGGARLLRDRPFVIPQGGEYFFAPGIGALGRLVRGELAE